MDKHSKKSTEMANGQRAKFYTFQNSSYVSKLLCYYYVKTGLPIYHQSSENDICVLLVEGLMSVHFPLILSCN